MPTTTTTPKAPAVKRSRAKQPEAAPTAPEQVVSDLQDAVQAAHDRDVARLQAGAALLPGAVDALAELRAALEGAGADDALEAAGGLGAAATAVRRALAVRKQTPPRERTPKGEAARYRLVGEDGIVLKSSRYRPSVSRDRSEAKRRIGTAAERATDAALAVAELIDAEAERVAS